MLWFPDIITLVELYVWKVCWERHWLDAESGRSPNNGCTLHQWEHPFQQSVPHMALRPLLHALSRQRVSFMLQDSGSLQAFSRINCFDPIWPFVKGRLCTHCKKISETDALWTVREVEPTEQVIFCARTEAGDLHLDDACNQWGDIFINIDSALKESLSGSFTETPFKTQHRSFVFFRAHFSCGALDERSALGWTFCCLPKCFTASVFS